MKEEVIELNVKDIVDFPKHSFKINNDLNYEELKDSILDNGILVPAIVRKKEDGKYEMILVHRDKKYLSECKNKIEKLCNDLLDLELNEKTQIGMVKNGIDFLGYRHILSSAGKIIVKLRYSSKRRLKKHLKTVNKLYNKGIVDDEYVYQRKNSFYNHIKDTNESIKLKVDTFPFK